MTAFRFVFIAWLAAATFVAGEAIAAQSLPAAPATPASPAVKADKTGKSDKTAKSDKAGKSGKADKNAKTGKSNKADKTGKDKASKSAKTAKDNKADKTVKIKPTTAVTPVSLRPGTAALATVPSASAAPAGPPMRSGPPFAMASSMAISPLDLNTVKQAIELAHRGRPGDATGMESQISDPVARKLVEWVVLRSDDSDADFARYAAFIAANPTWPSVPTLRRRAEAALWQERSDPQTILAFFRAEPPHSAKGKFALARALLAQGDATGAAGLVRDAWRYDAFSAEAEAQARDAFAGIITTADDEARMNVRLYVEDEDAGMRAAHHLDPVEFAIARARVAVIDKAGNAKALLDAIPAAAQRDSLYMFSRIQWLRRNDKIAEAAQWMLAAPRDPAVVGDPDQWWIERRLIARKLLDTGEFKTAYEIASAAAPPKGENLRAEQQFTAGWIALRFLHEPTMALAHFARIADGVTNPITLARSFYWQGRAAEAAGRDREARGYYETAAHYPTAYYGQIARARLGLDEVTLRPMPAPPAGLHALELAKVFEILYAIDARDLLASMAAELGDKATDGDALAMLAEVTTHHNDARATILIGKPALGRGFPFEHYAFPDFGVPEFQQIGPQVERCVIYSIVRQESAFNPRVVSSANALGLMQVTPAAGRDTAKKFNVTFNQKRLMDDVAYNAQLGSAELGSDIADYRGSYILAFVAYNAGRGRARQWIEQYGDPRDPKVDPIDWIERIPISETRNYVQRVLENMQVYRARLDNSPKLLIEADLHRGG